MNREWVDNRAGRLRAIGLLVAALVVTIASPASADHGAKPCEGQDVAVSKHSLEDAELASLCLVNLYRRANDLPALVLHSALGTAARWHSVDMVERDYFGHEAPPPAPHGRWPQDRADKAGYPGGVGENAAAFGNPQTTPHEIFNGFKASPGHDGNMLSRRPDDGSSVPYQAGAVGLAIGAPEIMIGGTPLGPDGVTATQVFGLVADRATYTALDLAGGNPNATRSCKSAREARKQAHKRWKKARKAKQRAQRKLKKADTAKAKRKLAKNLQRKRKTLAKRRAALRRATEKQKALC